MSARTLCLSSPVCLGARLCENLWAWWWWSWWCGWCWTIPKTQLLYGFCCCSLKRSIRYTNYITYICRVRVCDWVCVWGFNDKRQPHTMVTNNMGKASSVAVSAKSRSSRGIGGSNISIMAPGFRLVDGGGDNCDTVSSVSRNSIYKLKIDAMFDDTR